MQLLTTNKKLEKAAGGYTIYGLNLAPHNLSGYNVCKFAGACSEVCIGEHSGFMRMNSVRQAQIRRTHMLFKERRKFLNLLHQDLQKLEKKLKPACRLNVDSDLPWEEIDRSLFDYNIVFYDYTKDIERATNYVKGKLPSNYHLTYSWSEKSDRRKTNRILTQGGRVNIVFSTHYIANSKKRQSPLPTSIKIGTKTWNVIDGDVHDLRIPQMGESGVVTGVRAKIRKDQIEKYIKKGFFVNGGL